MLKWTGRLREVRQTLMKLINDIISLNQASINSSCPLPLLSYKVSAGFPSPVEDYVEEPLDLNSHLITHPAATFFVRAIGDSMIDAGIFPNDILIVDRSLKASSGKVIIAMVDGDLTVKRLLIEGARISLIPANAFYRPIGISEGQNFEVWGVVTYVVHQV